MKLYNTLTRSVDDLQPLSPPTVTVYTCGPTVYDYAHIGHWFTYVRWDLLIRTLAASGLKPQWVMNITDVGHLVSDADEGEDKLEKGARREGKTAWDVAAFYTDDFVECMRLLNMSTPDFMPRATEHIQEQIDLIKKLEEKGYTYRINDGMYYDTSKFEGYAAFARLDLNELQAGARVKVNPEKRNPTDFALWKFSPTDHQRDMEWDSPWGKGFPGWHIECSAMSIKYLGETLDIHTGGIDHVPVHHTNEIAQSEAATGKRFAQVWMHANHVMVNGEKISKSLSNGIRLQDVIDKGFPPQVVRLHVLESQYRSQSKFSWESLEAAKNRLQAYTALADLVWQLPEEQLSAGTLLHDTQTAMLQALQDDLDTPTALMLLSELEGQWPRILGIESRETLSAFLSFIDQTLGLELSKTEDLTQDQYELIEQRDEARRTKDWAKSDQLRDELASQKIGLRDTPDGSVWYRLA